MLCLARRRLKAGCAAFQKTCAVHAANIEEAVPSTAVALALPNPHLTVLNHTKHIFPSAALCIIYIKQQTPNSQLSPRKLISPPGTPAPALALVRSATRELHSFYPISRAWSAQVSEKSRGGGVAAAQPPRLQPPQTRNKRGVYLECRVPFLAVGGS